MPINPGTRRGRMALAASLAVLLAVLAATVALAQGDLGGKIRTGRDVVIPAGETHAGDLYVFGGSLAIDGSVDGDLTAAGGQVTIRGAVTGDVLVAGGAVRVEGEVTGDLRVAGGQVTVTGSVGEDALLTAGQLDVASGASIGEDVILSAGQATLAGSTGGSITGFAGAYNRTGSVGGTDEVVVAPQDPPRDQTFDRVLDAVQHFVAALLLGLLALWLVPRLVADAEDRARRQPLLAAGWGLVAFIGFIVALIVLGIGMVVIGWALGLAGLDVLAALTVGVGVVTLLALSLLYAIAVAFLADVVVGLALAWFIGRRAGPGRDERRLDAPRLLALVIGLLVVVVLTVLPIVGPWIKTAVVLVGTGALLLAISRRRRPIGGAPPGPREAPATGA